MDFNKMGHVLAKRARVANTQRRGAAQRKSQRELATSTYVARQREQTQLRREQFSHKSLQHVGSKLALYSKAVNEANMRKSSSSMRRVNRHPNPNPASAAPARQSSQPEQHDAGAPSPEARRPQPEPNIWGKMYAYEKAQADDLAKEKELKEREAQAEHVAYLATQVQRKQQRKKQEVDREAKYAVTEAAQIVKWREEEKVKAAEEVAKAARQKKMFADALELTAKRRAKETADLHAEEMLEVARIKRGQRAAEKRALKEKRRQKAILESFQKQRKIDDAIQAKVTAKKQLEEKAAAKDAERLMDKMDADRQRMLDDQQSHQAYLYGKAENVQDKIAKELKEQERKMLEAFAEQNRKEDEKAARKARDAKERERAQKESIRDQLARQAKARREQAEFEFRLAHKAKVQDELEAFEMMQQHVEQRNRAADFHKLLSRQRSDDRRRKKASKKTMTELEERLNATKIQEAEAWWERKMAADRANPGDPLPACIGVADIGMR